MKETAIDTGSSKLTRRFKRLTDPVVFYIGGASAGAAIGCFILLRGLIAFAAPIEPIEPVSEVGEFRDGLPLGAGLVFAAPLWGLGLGAVLGWLLGGLVYVCRYGVRDNSGAEKDERVSGSGHEV